MKRYKLLKDLPTFKAGQLAYVSSLGNLMAGTPEEPETADTGLNLMMYHRGTLEKFPNILTEWFEEIEEPTDSVHWKPKYDDWYFYISDHGSVCSDIWNDNYTDNKRLAFGFVYRTEEECEKAKERRLAKVKLQQTSTFKPDFENGKGGWVVFYSYVDKELHSMRDICTDSGELVRYETEEEAKRSIRKNREDWLIYFGVKEEE